MGVNKCAPDIPTEDARLLWTSLALTGVKLKESFPAANTVKRPALDTRILRGTMRLSEV
jgi:hypothetical protein